MTKTEFGTPFEMGVNAVLTVEFFGGIAWLNTNGGSDAVTAQGRHP